VRVHLIPLATAPVKASFVTMDGDRRQRIPLTIGALLIDHPKGRALVDAGLPEEPSVVDRAMAFGLTRRLGGAYRSLPTVLADQGVDPDSITELVLTHLHWDHTGAVDRFRRARTFVGPGEIRAAKRGTAFIHGFVGARRELSEALGARVLPAHDVDVWASLPHFPESLT
jgi:glyoxylase-like metal-dependent hydrolase (beta-lactamase superfamily II)